MQDKNRSPEHVRSLAFSSRSAFCLCTSRTRAHPPQYHNHTNNNEKNWSENVARASTVGSFTERVLASAWSSVSNKLYSANRIKRRRRKRKKRNSTTINRIISYIITYRSACAVLSHWCSAYKCAVHRIASMANSRLCNNMETQSGVCRVVTYIGWDIEVVLCLCVRMCCWPTSWPRHRHRIEGFAKCTIPYCYITYNVLIGEYLLCICCIIA